MKKCITLLWYQFLVMGQEYVGLTRKKAEKNYNRALQYFLGVNKFTANLCLQGDSGGFHQNMCFIYLHNGTRINFVNSIIHTYQSKYQIGHFNLKNTIPG